VAKFRGIAHSTAKVVGANALSIEPILDPLFVKTVGDPRPRWSVCKQNLVI